MLAEIKKQSNLEAVRTKVLNYISFVSPSIYYFNVPDFQSIFARGSHASIKRSSM